MPANSRRDLIQGLKGLYYTAQFTVWLDNLQIKKKNRNECKGGSQNKQGQFKIRNKLPLTQNIITFLLLPTWYTNFLFLHTNYIKLNFSTCFERNPLIIRRWTSQIVHMRPLVSSLSASDRLVQPLRKKVQFFLSGCTRRSLAESDDTRGCICTICIVHLLMMSGLRSKHVEEPNFM